MTSRKQTFHFGDEEHVQLYNCPDMGSTKELVRILKSLKHKIAWINYPNVCAVFKTQTDFMAFELWRRGVTVEDSA